MSGFPTEEPLPSSPAWARARVHPGTGLVSRRGDTLLVVPELRRAHHEAVRRLVELCSRLDPTGRARVDELRALLDRHTGADLPGFALLMRAGGTVRAVVHGPVRILVDGRAPERQPGEAALAEHVLDDGAWFRVTIAAGGGTADGDAEPPDVDDLPLDLESGTVPGGGVTLDRVPARRPPSPPAAEPMAAAFSAAPSSSTALRPAVQFRTVLLGECAVRSGGQGARGRRRPPLPVAGAPGESAVGAGMTESEVLVEGVLCPDGHFTDPEQPTCRTCGTPLPPDGHRERRPRPPLGVVVTDGGTVYPVTGDFVIGREPERAPDVLAGRARPLPLRDAARSTSRVHAHLTVQGWQVVLSDDSSANGTLVSRHGAAGPWLPVTPRGPLALKHGDRVRLGQRQLLFDAWRETVVPRVPH
jgi:hypothetical protein